MALHEQKQQPRERLFPSPIPIRVVDRYGVPLTTLMAASQSEGFVRIGNYLKTPQLSITTVAPFLLESYHGTTNMSASFPVAPEGSRRQKYVRWEVPDDVSELLRQGQQFLVIPEENDYDAWAKLYQVGEANTVTLTDKAFSEIHIDRKKQRVTSNDWLGAEKAVLFRILSGEITDLSQIVSFSAILQARNRAFVGNELRLTARSTDRVPLQVGDEIRYVPTVQESYVDLDGFLQQESQCIIVEPVSRYRIVTLPTGERKIEFRRHHNAVYDLNEWAHGRLPIEQTQPVDAQTKHKRYVMPKDGMYRDLRFDVNSPQLADNPSLQLIPSHDPHHLYEWLRIDREGTELALFRKLQKSTGETFLRGGWQGYEMQSWHDYYTNTPVNGKPVAFEQIYPQRGVVPPRGNKLRIWSGENVKYTVFITKGIDLDPEKTYDLLPVPDDVERLKCAIYESGTNICLGVLSIHKEKTNYPKRRKEEQSLDELFQQAERNEKFEGYTL